MNFSDPLLNFSFIIRRFRHSPMFQIHHVPKLQRDQREVRRQVISLQIWYIWPLVLYNFFYSVKANPTLPDFLFHILLLKVLNFVLVYILARYNTY